ncbi:hypothetical protein [Wielerella bovis]|uniref:hypothetical protein n=1 Tax=Wielerella bovis TaxID=2917790 RepID=UPI002019798D|nr:hypothetical protein [Wielerella bovis]ULJ64180.1 hypothetical protein MIS33_08450 [Wielerella bovis]ULJ67905.1 hypothetical protein MIS31_05020 [Wielerella bovis]
MSYLTEFLRRQIAYWQGVLARADPKDEATCNRAKRELATYQKWLESCHNTEKD